MISRRLLASGASADGRGDALVVLRADPVLPHGLGLERAATDAQVITDGRPEWSEGLGYR